MSLRSLLPRSGGALMARQAMPTAAVASSSSASSSSSSTPHRLFSSSPAHLASREMAIERATSDEDDDLFDEIDASESGSVDEVPTIGHLKINRQRELLKYFRLVVHDFPHLEQFRQAYNPPPASSLLRFRSVHYQGDAKPVTRKSVLTVDVAELFASEHFAKLSNAQMRKFLHLAGTHWIPGDEYRGSDLVKEVYREDGAYSDVPAPAVGHIKISCERFPHENQNIKWCSDVFDALLAEVKVESAESDAIAQQPLDLRAQHTRKAKRMHSGGPQRVSVADWPQEWGTPREQQQQRDEAERQRRQRKNQKALARRQRRAGASAGEAGTSGVEQQQQQPRQ